MKRNSSQTECNKSHSQLIDNSPSYNKENHNQKELYRASLFLLLNLSTKVHNNLEARWPLA